MKIDKLLIERIKNAVNIEDIVSEHLTLRPSGSNKIGLCPFHHDTTPSLIVSPSKQRYKCYACGAGGDVFQFVQEMEQISFFQALKNLSEKTQIPLPSEPLSEKEQAQIRERESNLILLKKVAQYYQSQQKEAEAQEFFAQRNIQQSTLDTFGIGYAPAQNPLLQMCTNGQIDGKRASELKLIKSGDKGKYDTFRERIIYPFYSLSGNVIAYTARAIRWSKGDRYAKFLNSDESPLFVKGNTLYGLYQTKRHIAQADKVYLMEGQHDVLSFYQYGVKNVVCGSGTALTETQVKTLMRFTTNITIVYDGDNAGKTATQKAIKLLTEMGAKVRIVSLPQDTDPDQFAQQNKEQTQTLLNKYEVNYIDYLIGENKEQLNDPFLKSTIIEQLAYLIANTQDKILRQTLIRHLQNAISIPPQELLPHIKAHLPQQPKATWKRGFNGLQEAKELHTENPKAEILITYDKNVFAKNYYQKPIIYPVGKISKSDIQYFHTQIQEIYVTLDNPIDPDNEDDAIQTLKKLYQQGVKITVIYDGDIETDDNEQSNLIGFLDFYIRSYREPINRATETQKATYIERCAELLSFAPNTVRTVMMKTYGKLLDISATDLKEVLKPHLEKRKDKQKLEKQRINEDNKLLEFDPETVPNYVYEDDVYTNTYNKEGFYPLLDKQMNPVSYMFRNEKGGGHTCISDFYIVPILHIHAKESAMNKRIIQLNHRTLPPKYVEWQSSIFATLGKVNEKLIEEGAYNYDGSMTQFKRIFRSMSYDFTPCEEMKVFGQQPEEFWAFSNAIIYEENGQMKVQYADKMGVMTYKDKNYYSPAFSEIYNSQRWDSDPYEQDRYFVYKEVEADKRIDFKEWARQMDEVYKIEDNGKWAVLFDILCCFRDLIYDKKRFFTTLFFIGPTSSGKSQIAESLRSLFIAPHAPKFNLNNGTNAAFSMTLQKLANVPTIMEEYNDNEIHPEKFQGLKAAVLDGEGKIKVKDVSTNSLNVAKVNSIPIILGQEAPQQDDGSLANRSILCEVPYKEKGEWTDYETTIFDKLKTHEHAGLSNVLMEIISIRSIVKKHFINIFDQEVKTLKDETRVDITNTEGLTRILNSVSLITAMCKLIETHTSLELPFTYTTFRDIATAKILNQVNTISTSNKLTNFFQTINYLLTQGSIQYGRELKVSNATNGAITVKEKGNETNTIEFNNPETEILYVQLSAIYPLYARSTESPLSKQSLVTYFKSNAAYYGLVKSTRFIWYEEINTPRKALDNEGNETGVIYNDKQLVKRTSNTSAFAFNYEILTALLDIDFKREETVPEIELDNEQQENSVPF